MLIFWKYHDQKGPKDNSDAICLIMTNSSLEYHSHKCTNILLSFPANIPILKRIPSLIRECHGLKISLSFQEE